VGSLFFYISFLGVTTRVGPSVASPRFKSAYRTLEPVGFSLVSLTQITNTGKRLKIHKPQAATMQNVNFATCRSLKLPSKQEHQKCESFNFVLAL